MNNQQKLRELLCLKLKLMRLRRKRLLLSALQKPRRIYQRNILQKRPAVGEFSSLVSDLKSKPKDFFEYFRMQRTAFDEILDFVKEKIWHPPKAHLFQGCAGCKSTTLPKLARHNKACTGTHWK